MRKRNTTSYLEFEKNLNEIDFIAQLILGILKDTQEEYIFLKGEIGTGKTTLVKAIAKHLKEKEEVISPTFNKMLVYDNFVHIDAYNMEGQNLEQFQDYFVDKLVIIEWPDKLNQEFNQGFEIEISYLEDNNKRKYTIRWKD